MTVRRKTGSPIEPGEVTKKVNPITIITIIAISIFFSLMLFSIIDSMDKDAEYFDYAILADFKANANLRPDRTISIRNKSNSNWTPKEWDIGKGVAFIIGKDYTYLYPKTIKPREIIKIPLDKFTNERGKNYRFPVSTVKQIVIRFNEGMEILTDTINIILKRKPTK